MSDTFTAIWEAFSPYWTIVGDYYFTMTSGLEAQAEEVAPLVARFVVGAMFTISGHCKLFNSERRKIMYETLVFSGVPFPRFNTIFVSLAEWVFGFLLLIGMMTVIANLVLGLITFVAFMTVGRREIKGSSAIWRLSELLYLPEVFIMALIVIIAMVGPGKVSVDYLLFLVL